MLLDRVNQFHAVPHWLVSARLPEAGPPLWTSLNRLAPCGDTVRHMSEPVHELPDSIELGREEYRVQHSALEAALDLLDRIPERMPTARSVPRSKQPYVRCCAKSGRTSMNSTTATRLVLWTRSKKRH